MQLEVGTIFEGKVTGITKFGAFVTLPEGGSGLVHISEIANSYVNDVHDHVTEGQMVKVKVIGIGDGGKVNLSIKKAEPPAPAPAQAQGGYRDRESHEQRESRPQRSFTPRPAPPTGDLSFEDKLKQFMQDSNTKNSGNRLYADNRGPTRRRK